MKIAYIHYHLKTGGVTTVIRQQIEACGDDCEVLLLTGMAPDTSFAAPVKVIRGLGYDIYQTVRHEPVDVAREIMDAIRSHFGGLCDLVHVHNPTLAKNRHFIQILKILQSEGCTLLLQIHDFAEDGRPLAYFDEPYPEDCHYAAINSRDHQLLCSAGGKTEGVHKLANTVSLPKISRIPETIEPRILYPVRAIRRKNIGEAILLSLFFKPEEYLAITLPPNSPADVKSYDGWKRFAARRKLRVEFEAGLHREFPDLVQTSNFLLTTSITEGFGFSFLEPWLYYKMIWGRKLQDICSDFEAVGIDLSNLYPQLGIPLDWIDAGSFYTRWSETVMENCRRFNYPVDRHRIETAFDGYTAGRQQVDFGLLDESFQKKAIEHVLTNVGSRQKLFDINPFFRDLESICAPQDLIQSNRQTILANYSVNRYRHNLLNTYARVSRQPVRQRIDKKILLDYFIDLEHFSLLKWGKDVE